MSNIKLFNNRQEGSELLTFCKGLKTERKTPKVFNVDNPVQAEGAARGKEWRTVPYNPVGVELLAAHCSAPTEHRDRALHRHTPSCATLARGYHRFASYGGRCYHPLPLTVKAESLKINSIGQRPMKRMMHKTKSPNGAASIKLNVMNDICEISRISPLRGLDIGYISVFRRASPYAIDNALSEPFTAIDNS